MSNPQIAESFEMIKRNLKGVGVNLDKTTYRMGRTLNIDPKTERFIGDPGGRQAADPGVSGRLRGAGEGVDLLPEGTPLLAFDNQGRAAFDRVAGLGCGVATVIFTPHGVAIEMERPVRTIDNGRRVDPLLQLAAGHDDAKPARLVRGRRCRHRRRGRRGPVGTANNMPCSA